MAKMYSVPNYHDSYPSKSCKHRQYLPKQEGCASAFTLALLLFCRRCITYSGMYLPVYREHNVAWQNSVYASYTMNLYFILINAEYDLKGNSLPDHTHKTNNISVISKQGQLTNL